jgi:uncharacterized membrane protein
MLLQGCIIIQYPSLQFQQEIHAYKKRGYKMRYKMTPLFILLCILISSTVFARKGVGIVWDTETEIVTENTLHCIQYGIYNPWEEDVTASLGVSSELQGIIVNQQSESKLIKAGTNNDVAVPIEFCFKVAKVYNEDCLVGGLVCEQTCSGDEITYDGKIMATEGSTGSSAEAAGSSTTLGVSVPLKLRVKCTPHPRDWTLVYVVIIIIVVILILLILYKKQKNK